MRLENEEEVRKACDRLIKIRNMNQARNQTYLEEAMTRIDKLLLNVESIQNEVTKIKGKTDLAQQDYKDVKTALERTSQELNKFNTDLFVNIEVSYKERINFGELIVSFNTKRTKSEGIHEKKGVNGPWLDPTLRGSPKTLPKLL